MAIYWERPCYKCRSHTCNMSCPEPSVKPDLTVEPVAYMTTHNHGGEKHSNSLSFEKPKTPPFPALSWVTPLYTHPAPEAKQEPVNQQLLEALKIACDHMGMSELENSYPNDARIIAAAIKAAEQAQPAELTQEELPLLL